MCGVSILYFVICISLQTVAKKVNLFFPNMEKPKFIPNKFAEQSWRSVCAEINAIIPISGMYEYGDSI